MKYTEVNFDGIVGPTHNYAGLAHGNLASQKNRLSVSNPKKAALQGLEKMKLLHDLGVPQAILPPHPVPHVDFLRAMGFEGTWREIIEKVAHRSPELLAMVYSSSSMWAANSAIITPSPDSPDGKVHITPANLVSNIHRSLETPFTARVLKLVFHSDKYFRHHDPAPVVFPDEGSANVVRLCEDYKKPGFHLLVYGRDVLRNTEGETFVSGDFFRARQSREAFEIMARNHRLNLDDMLMVRQNEMAVKSGVFHNDVISFGNKNIFIYHEMSFQDTDSSIKKIDAYFRRRENTFYNVKIDSKYLSLEESVNTYLFNSQLVSTSEKEMSLIAPLDCEKNTKTKEIIERIIKEDNPVRDVHYVDLGESMRNGGGPACLRLRAVLSEAERENVHPAFIFSTSLYHKLKNWIGAHYRDRIIPSDLADYKLAEESRIACESLSNLLEVENLYEFP